MKRLLCCVVLLAASLSLFGGCGQNNRGMSDKRGAETAPNAATPQTAPSKTPSSNADPAVDIKLEAVSCETWDKALAAQRGKVVVVDTWATWCGPCVEEFPNLVALHGKFTGDGVVCMSMTMDEKESREAALTFLKKQKATFANYIIDDKEDAWYDKWEFRAIPLVLVFDRDGKLAKKFDKEDPDNQFTYADVEKLVVELLKQNEPKKS